MALHEGAPCKPKQVPSQPLAFQTVIVFHPGYSPPIPMFTIPAYADGSGGYGVPYLAVLEACRILAQNLGGTLRQLNSAVDIQPVSPSSSRLQLKPGWYTYNVAKEHGQRYPICTTFRAWAPPATLPPTWTGPAMGAARKVVVPPSTTSSAFSEVITTFDRRCAVTGNTSRLECCRLVPSSEAPWWRHHAMGPKINDISGLPTSPANCLALRADLTTAGLDSGHFVFAPYGDGANEAAVVCLCLTRWVADFAADYHLRAVTLPERIHPWTTFVRFAWGVFKASEDILGEFRRHHDGPAVVLVPRRLVEPTSSSSKRKPGDEDEDEDDDNDEGERRESKIRRVVEDDGDSAQEQESSDEEVPVPFDLCHPTARDLAAAERIDAALHERPLAPYEEASGMYPGYSRFLRLADEYKKSHPAVSALGEARVARVGEGEGGYDV
ncbi:hypothetical protein C8R46DRAFT_1348539 [Mycena filopes]|nr:hypothetical protein C8R46DRAFT_1348539 [Mycena filopes]